MQMSQLGDFRPIQPVLPARHALSTASEAWALAPAGPCRTSPIVGALGHLLVVTLSRALLAAFDIQCPALSYSCSEYSRGQFRLCSRLARHPRPCDRVMPPSVAKSR
jgi:hypothetical protein